MPPHSQALLNHGQALLTDFNSQGLALHNLTFQQKEVASKIEEMIQKFKNHQAMEQPTETINVLKEVKSSFILVKDNIQSLDDKEKEMSQIIQEILVRQQEGATEESNITQDITRVQGILSATEEQIRMGAELRQLEKNIKDAERRVRRRKRRRGWLWVGTFLTAGVLGVGLVHNYKSVNAAKRDLSNRRQMFTSQENNIRNLQGTLQSNQQNMVKLQMERSQRQFELRNIGSMLDSLRPAQLDTITYRQYLLDLSDAFNQIDTFVDNLYRNLDTLRLAYDAGQPPEESMVTMVDISCQNLADSWIGAKVQPAVTLALNLQDPHNPEATLTAIKTMTPATGRKKRFSLFEALDAVYGA